MKHSALRNLLTIMLLAGFGMTSGKARSEIYYEPNFPDLDWLTVETEHFYIHYYPDIEWTARMMVKYAEIMYPKVTGLFDFPLKEKVHIVLRDQEENANGFAVYNDDWVTVWATSLYYPLRGRQEWIPDCITHEFTHIVSLKADDWKSESAFIIFGSALIEDGTHNLDFGAGLLVGFNEPYWWAEGIAEYGDHLSGFNWWTTARDMMQRTSFLEDNYLTYDEMFTPGGKDAGFDRERGYQQGYAMGLYVMEKFGREQYAQLGLNSSKKGHLVWEKNIEDVLGVDGQQLWEGWAKWMKDRYERQAEPIRKEEHVGRELLTTSIGEEVDFLERLPDGRVKMQLGKRHYEDPVPADAEETKELEEAKKKEKPKYEYWDKRRRKQFFESQGQWSMIPRSTKDGKFTAYGNRMGVNVVPLGADEWPVFSGRYLNKKKNEKAGEDSKQIHGASVFNGYDLSPDGKKVLFSSLQCPQTWLPCISIDGYYRYDLYTFDIETEKVERLSKRLRAVYPAYSPDGKNIAFVHMEDGQNFLGLMPADARDVQADGTCTLNGEKTNNCVRWLIKKHDGTQLGSPSFSPDSGKIAIDLYRNRQQDVWIVNADGSDLHPVTWDRAEDRDSSFTPDGKHILYSSDRSGVFNAYLLNLETKEVKQLTNVTGGVFTPTLTPSGNLMYSYFTSYGLRLQGLKKEDFYNKTIDAGYNVTPEEVARNLAYEEPLPEIREKSTSYNPFSLKNWRPPMGVPMFLYERQGLTLGAQSVLSDYLGKQSLFGMALLGSQTVYAMGYWNNFWYPTLFLFWQHVAFGYDFSQSFNSSEQAPGSAELRFDQPLIYKARQYVDFGGAGITIPLNDQWEAELGYGYRYYTSLGSTQSKEQAFLTNNSYEAKISYEMMAPGGEGDINPRGRKASVDYNFYRTGLPTKQWADVEWLGRSNPPGDNSDDYTFHQIEFGYREAIPVTWWNDQGNHTLDLHIRAGFINRNVYRWDEFFGGSLHPLRFVPTQSTTQEFAGYPGFSLNGETMIILGASYRFPFYRHIDKMYGVFYFSSLWGEISTTAGNLWGFTADYMRDVYGNIQRNGESYWDPAVKPGSVHREIPFVDKANSNGNYMLYDVGFTLKLKGFIFGYLPWNSFIRVAYPLNDIYGQTDTNNDYVFVDNYPNDGYRSEMQPRSIRLSIGIGSDFE
jgi:hypothetical protein